MTDSQPAHPPASPQDVSRRSMVRGVALGSMGGLALPLLAACGSSSGGSGSDASSSSGSSGATVAASKVPVGEGAVLKSDKIVVTQPTAGEFKAFSAVCTHSGCLVDQVKDGKIICPCHGSEFSIEDGSATRGPATKPLAARTAKASGGTVTVS